MLGIVIFNVAQASAADPAKGSKPDIYDLPPIVAVQNREFLMNESVALNLNYLPSDAFNKGYGLSASYAYYFSDYFAWEVLNAQYILNQVTNIKTQLLNLGVAVHNVGNGGVLDYPRTILTTGLLYTPFYSKNLLFNRRLIPGDISLYLGTGAAFFNSTGIRPLITPGFQLRFFNSPTTAAKIFFRYHFYLDPQQGLTGMIDMGIGFEIKIDFLTGRRGKAQ